MHLRQGSALVLVLTSLQLTACDALLGALGKDKSEAKADDEDKKKKKKKKQQADDEDETPTAKPTAKAPSVEFAGIYRSTFGDVRVRQSGSTVVGTYPGSTITCVAEERDLDCTWKNEGNAGKAKLSKTISGDLDGTWGFGTNYSDGGRWLFTLRSSGDPGPTGDEVAAGSFAGNYVTTFGVVALKEEGTQVTGTYPGGSLRCTASGAALDCDWTEPSLKGKAKLTRRLNGDISGTWGSGSSATDGGTWLFRKK